MTFLSSLRSIISLRLLSAFLVPVFLVLGGNGLISAQQWLPEPSAELPWDTRTWPNYLSVDSDSSGRTYAFADRWHTVDEGHTGRVVIRSFDGVDYQEYELTDTSLDEFAFSVKMNADGRTLAVGGKEEGQISDYLLKVYDLTDDGDWQARPGPSLIGFDIRHFFDLSDDGRALLVIEPQAYENETENVGLVRVFDWRDGEWIQRGGEIIGCQEYAYAGTYFDFSGDGNTIAISDYSEDVRGTRVYTWSGTSWVKSVAQIDREGVVALNEAGDVLAIGRKYLRESAEPARGSAQVYFLDGAVWRLKGELLVGDEDGMEFGTSVALSAGGNTLVVGAPFHPSLTTDFVGHAKVYRYDSDTWNQLGENIHLGDQATDRHLGMSANIGKDGESVILTGRQGDTGIVVPFRRQLPTSVGGASAQGMARVFPLPVADGRLYVRDLPDLATGSYRYTVVSTAGRRLKSGMLTEIDNLWSADVTGVPPGIYVLQVVGPAGRTAHKFVVR